MKIIIKTSVITFAICLSTLAFSQVATQPAQPPWYFYWPTEDPDNFQYSDLGGSSLSGGNSFQRRSNVEVNKRVEEEEGTSSQTALDPSTNIDIDTEIDEDDLAARPASGENLFKWVDDEGVVHVTNNVGSIPEKFRDQVEN